MGSCIICFSDFVNTVISGIAFSLARRAAAAASAPAIGTPIKTPLHAGYRSDNKLAVINWDNAEGTNALLKVRCHEHNRTSHTIP